MVTIEITLDENRLANLKALFAKRDLLVPVIVATNEAIGYPGSEIHQAIDRTRNAIDADIVKLILAPLGEGVRAAEERELVRKQALEALK